MFKQIDSDLIEKCLTQARQSPRKRSHFNLHESLEAPVQRLCIALIDGTYVPPHRHPQSNKWELLVAIKGISLLVIFDDAGNIKKVFEISPTGPLSAVEIPPNTWHSLLPKEAESVVLEVKEGPYTPNKPEYFAAWAPEESSDQASEYLLKLRKSCG
ncbi:MAG: WbuC family cupin fold metalloprotein [Verrucomicrobia bacterium]|jgi:cupin fold WbuC family metalloprotein|nr:WbuC family cupin fold metalloprotein [Verrucomicrobiota bacterium]